MAKDFCGLVILSYKWLQKTMQEVEIVDHEFELEIKNKHNMK
jgi:hypothetical protein